MKPSIHPEYKDITVFYTGKQKILDTAGRVDKFRKKYAAAAAR